MHSVIHQAAYRQMQKRRAAQHRAVLSISSRSIRAVRESLAGAPTVSEPGSSSVSNAAISVAAGKLDSAPSSWVLLGSHAALRKCLGFLSLAQVCAARRIHSAIRRCADETLEDRLFLQSCASAGFAASERFDCWYVCHERFLNSSSHYFQNVSRLVIMFVS